MESPTMMTETSPTAYSDQELAEAGRLLDDLIAKRRQDDAPPDYLPTSDGDPGRVLLILLVAAMRRTAAEAADAARREAIDAVYRQTVGSPRAARPARCLVGLAGKAGVTIPASASGSSRS